MKAVKAIGLQWTDVEGRRWGVAAQIDASAQTADDLIRVALARLGEQFEDWRRE